MLSNILDRISFWSLFLTIVLLPVFFLPFFQIPAETSKGFLLVVGLAISIIFWAAARFSDGKIVLPKSHLLTLGFGIVLVFLVSALFSGASKISFFGIMFDIGTFWFVFAAYLLMLISSVVLRDKNNATKVLFGLLVSLTAVSVLQILRLFAPEFLSLGILGGKTSNLAGSWNTFGLLAGLFGILSLFVLEFSNISKKIKWILRVLVVFSIILAIIVNFSLVWELLGVFALLIFVYKISFSSSRNRGDEKKAPFPAFSFAVVMISLLFFMSGTFIGGYIPNRLGLSDLEISPSLGSTMQVAKESIKKDPIVGVGPNRFEEIWALYKPQIINNTVFWNTSFTTGSGLLPTFAATTGVLGIIAWLAFLGFILVSGLKMVFASIKKGENADIVIFFIASIYLFAASFFYASGAVIFLLAFAFTGIFIGLSVSNKEKGLLEFSFLDDPRKSFFSILLLVLLMIVSAAACFRYIQRFASVSYFGKAVSAQTIEVAESSIGRAILLHSNDLYLRTYSQVYLTKLNTLAAKGSALSESEKAEFQTNFDQAVSSAVLATKYNPNNYLNFQALGAVYRSVASLGLGDAYPKAIEVYTEAMRLNPLNPGLKLAVANIHYTNGKNKEARKSAEEALSLKSNYIDVLLVLSQIEKADGNSSLALSYAERALSFDPDNKNLIQYVDSLGGNSTPSVSENPKSEKEKKENN